MGPTYLKRHRKAEVARDKRILSGTFRISLANASDRKVAHEFCQIIMEELTIGARRRDGPRQPAQRPGINRTGASTPSKKKAAPKRKTKAKKKRAPKKMSKRK